MHTARILAHPRPASRRWLITAGGTALLATAVLLAGGRSAAADTAAVSINNFAFTPANATISVGGTVNWTNNQSAPHTVTADDRSFDSGRLTTGQGFTRTFTTAGSFAYHCDIHPTMHGTVTVTGAATTTSPQVTTAPSNSAPAAASGRALSLRGGYNLVGPPAGTTFADAPAYAFDTGANNYRQLSAGEATQAGQGYWVFESADASLALGAGSGDAVTLNAAAGAWNLIGNPSGTQAALVGGADFVYTYDALAGRYVAGTLLQPGQGAWALSQRGGAITITPGASAANATSTASAAPTQAATTAPVQTATPDDRGGQGGGGNGGGGSGGGGNGGGGNGPVRSGTPPPGYYGQPISEASHSGRR